MITILITTYKEPDSIKKAIKQIIKFNEDLWPQLKLLVCAPDQETLDSAEQELNNYLFKNYHLIKDQGKGKPNAINEASKYFEGDTLVFTDGDMYIDKNALKNLLVHLKNNNIGGVSGHPVSLESKSTQFGYYSHLFCAAANKKRINNPEISMSGYLFAMKNIPSIFPLPINLKAEDAYITEKIQNAGYQIAYEENALAYVHFPKNMADWFKQKKRSVGGNIQLQKVDKTATETASAMGRNSQSSPPGITADLTQNNRSQSKKAEKRGFMNDLSMITFPLTYAKTTTELIYSLALYPLRLILWIQIYLNRHNQNKSLGWERVESSKY